MPELNTLISLARSGRGEDRERLAAAIADLFDASPQAPSGEAGVLILDIFQGLFRRAGQDLRRRMAERIAPAPWAPHELILGLALDEIEAARAVIAKSPLLGDADLIRILIDAGLDHRIEVARRPGLGEAVVGAIIDEAEPEVLTALAGNTTAEVTPLAMARFVALSRRMAATRTPLARHPRLTAALARSLHSWVGATLRADLADRFAVDAEWVSGGAGAAAREAARADRSLPPILRPRPDIDEMERKLVQKLDSVGDLQPAYLLKALRSGRAGLFAYALAALARRDIEEIREAMAAGDPEPLARACAAAGVDRSAFADLVGLVRMLNDGYPREAAADGRAAAFG